MASMRICSLLPSSTEIVFALGLGDRLAGVTHECDYPAEAASIPAVTRSLIDHSESSSAEIHRHVSEAVHAGSSIYALDQALLERIDPGLVLTQELCDVCAVSYGDVQRAVRLLPSDGDNERTVLSLEPTTMGGVLDTIMSVGEAAGAVERAVEVTAALRRRIDAVEAAAAGAGRRPRVFAMEWLDPPFVGGHWVPEMIRLAGGSDGLGREGQPSVQATWADIEAYDPEVVVLMPCGYHLEALPRRVPQDADAARVEGPHRRQERRGVRGGRLVVLQPTRPQGGGRPGDSGRDPAPRDLPAGALRVGLAARRRVVGALRAPARLRRAPSLSLPQRGRGRSGRSAGDAFRPQALDLAGGHAEQAAEDFVLVFAEERGAAVIEPHVREVERGRGVRSRAHDGVLQDTQVAARDEMGVAVQVFAAGDDGHAHPGGGEAVRDGLRRLRAGPGGDQNFEGVFVLFARQERREAWIVRQRLLAHRGAQGAPLGVAS